MSALPFTLTGVVTRGKRLGSQLGFPTANVDYPRRDDLPRDGVYVAEVMLDDTRYLAILNQGHHPTAPEGKPTVEAHLLDYDMGDLYGRQVTLRYLTYLRPETKFATLDGLKAQLTADKQSARDWDRRNHESD